MSNELGQLVGAVVVVILAIAMLWLFSFGGLQTVVCDWLHLEALAVCG